MKNFYTTGQFAKLANISVRTIRYYDQIGLLKPSLFMENGYRKYKDADFKKLQRILALKQLGFSLEEIMSMIIDNDDLAMEKSLQLQSELLDKEINHLCILKDAVDSTLTYTKEHSLKWEQIIHLIKLTSDNEKVVNHYRSAYNLEVRIHLHELFMTNQIGWYTWIMKQVQMKKNDKILEVGAGNGAFWLNNSNKLNDLEIFISDISQGMIDKAKESLTDEFSFMVIDAHQIPFKKEYFNILIANHMLFYLHDMQLGLKEIYRVLKHEGIFYCSTYGKAHMMEITNIAKEFDPQITLSENPLADNFGLENGRTILKKFFKIVELSYYEDSLEITEAKPLFDYILSCHGNQKEKLAGKMDLFLNFLENKIKRNGNIHVTKQAGLFICIKT